MKRYRSEFKEQVEDVATVEELKKIFGSLKDEDFGNAGQRDKMVSMMARMKSLDTPEVRRFFKSLGDWCTEYLSK